MNISLNGANFSLNLTVDEADETKIEEYVRQSVPTFTAEMQSAIDAKYGILAERQARKAAGTAKPMTLEALAARIEALETELKELRK